MKGEGKAKRDKGGVVKMRCLAFEPELLAKNIREGQREKWGRGMSETVSERKAELLAKKGKVRVLVKMGKGRWKNMDDILRSK